MQRGPFQRQHADASQRPSSTRATATQHRLPTLRCCSGYVKYSLHITAGAHSHMREKAVVRILGPKCMITKRMWGRRWTRALHATRIIRNRGRRGADVPVFLDALLAVGEVLVDLHQLGLEHHPVRLQSRQYVYQVRLGLCQQRRASRHIARASCAAALQGVCADSRK